MTRQTHTPMTPLGGKASLYTANAADLTLTAASVAGFEQTAFTGQELVIAHNSDVTNPYTVTVESIADADLGRTGDITTYSLAAAEVGVFGPFPSNGWRQADGMLYFKGSNAAILFGVVRIP